jgi:hypothetical protein
VIAVIQASSELPQYARIVCFSAGYRRVSEIGMQGLRGLGSPVRIDLGAAATGGFA